MARAGPGVLLRDVLRGDPAAEHAADRIAARAPDVLLLMGFDWDHEGRALAAFQALLADRGHAMPHRFAPRPNRGLASGADLDGDGRLGRPDDAQGWGRFLGEGGMALLSRLPIEAAAARDLSDLLWRDLPGANLADDAGAPVLTPEAAEVQRLSSTGHWDVPLVLPGGGWLRVLAWHATPPVFDGPEDRNGRRKRGRGAGVVAPSRRRVRRAASRAVRAHGRRRARPARRGRPRRGDGGAPRRPAPPGPRSPRRRRRRAPGGGGPGPARRSRARHRRLARRSGARQPQGGLRAALRGAARARRRPLDWPAADRPEGASRHAMVWVDVAIP